MDGLPPHELVCIYEDVEEDVGDRQNNVLRLYYLKGPLSQGGWRFLCDLVRDSPHITAAQTERLLEALDQLAQPRLSCARRGREL